MIQNHFISLNFQLYRWLISMIMIEEEGIIYCYKLMFTSKVFFPWMKQHTIISWRYPFSICLFIYSLLWSIGAMSSSFCKNSSIGLSYSVNKSVAVWNAGKMPVRLMVFHLKSSLHIHLRVLTFFFLIFYRKALYF